jgi:hypothetical protein
MAQSRRQRLDRQRERQQALRAEASAQRKPSRDDIARTLLHWAITENIKHGREEEIYRLQVQVVEHLVIQGFDRRASDTAWDALVDKYRNGWAFQTKRRLKADDGDGKADGV